jgi:hypothetical protein
MSNIKAKPVTFTAALIVDMTITADKSAGALTSATVQWVNFELDTLAKSVARDASGAKVARKHIQSALVAACVERGSKPVAQGGLGRAGKGLGKMKDAEVIEAVLGASRLASWRAYLSGVARAYKAGVAWNTQSHHTPAEKVSANTATSAKALDDAAVKVASDKKARTVTFSAGSKAAINADDVQKVISAITSDPGRMALTLSYIKAQGWTTE